MRTASAFIVAAICFLIMGVGWCFGWFVNWFRKVDKMVDDLIQAAGRL